MVFKKKEIKLFSLSLSRRSSHTCCYYYDIDEQFTNDFFNHIKSYGSKSKTRYTRPDLTPGI